MQPTASGYRKPAVREQQGQEHEEAKVRHPDPGCAPGQNSSERERAWLLEAVRKWRIRRKSGVSRRRGPARRRSSPSGSPAAGGDQGSDRRTTYRDQDALDPVVEDVDVGMGEVQDQKQEAKNCQRRPYSSCSRQAGLRRAGSSGVPAYLTVISRLRELLPDATTRP